MACWWFAIKRRHGLENDVIRTIDIQSNKLSLNEIISVETFQFN